MSKSRYSAWRRFREILKSRGELGRNPFVRDVGVEPDDVESETEEMRDDTLEPESEALHGATEETASVADAAEAALQPDAQQEAAPEVPVAAEESVQPDPTGGSGVDLAEILASSSEGEEEEPCGGAQEPPAGDESDVEAQANVVEDAPGAPAALAVDCAQAPIGASEAAPATAVSGDQASSSPGQDAQTLHFGKLPLESVAPPETEPNEPTVGLDTDNSEEESASFVKEVMSELDDSTFLIASESDAASAANAISAKEGISLATAALPLWQDLEREEQSSMHELRSLQGRRRQLVESFLDALRDGEARLDDVQSRLSKARQESNQAQQRTWQTSQQLQAANDRIHQLEAQLTDLGASGREVDELRQAVSDREREVAELARTSEQLAHDLEAAKSHLEQEQIKARSQLEAVLRRVAELERATSVPIEAAVEAKGERPANGLAVQELAAQASNAPGTPFTPKVLEGGASAAPKEGDLALQSLREELQDLG